MCPLFVPVVPLRLAPSRRVTTLPLRTKKRVRTARCSLDDPHKAHHDSLTRKVEESLLDAEQAPPPPSPSKPHPIPMHFVLLAYHARNLTRNKSTRPTAEAMYTRILHHDHTDARAWIGLARLRAADSRYEEARAAFREGSRSSPKNPHLLQAWGVFEERCGDKTRALSLFEAATAADKEHCPSWVALGLWYQRYPRDYSKAAYCFSRGVEANPVNYYVWHVWGMLERERQNYPAARRYFKKGIQANPKNGATYVVWGALEARLGKLDDAQRLFRKAHKVAPRNAHAFVSHANAAERAGHPGRARVLLEKAMFLRPKDPAPLQALAMLEHRGGDIRSARKAFEAAVKLDPKHAPSWHSWACIEKQCSEINRARQLFQQAVWADPQKADVVKTWHAWATLELQEGRTDMARRYVGLGLEVNKKCAPLLTLLAVLETRKPGGIDRARMLLEEALSYAPKELSTWTTYYEIERNYGNAEKAAAVYERSLIARTSVNERFAVSDAQAGDFAATAGTWVGTADLKGRKAAVVRETGAMKSNTNSTRPDKKSGKTSATGNYSTTASAWSTSTATRPTVSDRRRNLSDKNNGNSHTYSWSRRTRERYRKDENRQDNDDREVS